MKLKFKYQTSKIIIAFITILAFSSCKKKDFDKEMYGYTDAESIEKPSVEKIKNDLIGKKFQAGVLINWKSLMVMALQLPIVVLLMNSTSK